MLDLDYSTLCLKHVQSLYVADGKLKTEIREFDILSKIIVLLGPIWMGAVKYRHQRYTGSIGMFGHCP